MPTAVVLAEKKKNHFRFRSSSLRNDNTVSPQNASTFHFTFHPQGHLQKKEIEYSVAKYSIHKFLNKLLFSLF